MAAKLYVGGLSYEVKDDQLRELFETVGKVESAQIIVDRFSNQSKGFGFVEMSTEAEAQEAIKQLNGKDLAGRSIMVNVARPQEDRSRGSFGPPKKFNNNRKPRY
ncbi:MAG TPA: RNA-binding protein [Candidatus Sulfotelmatobacter sp.]|nr:RNA-binding protein [Candidatus Sulfotelmatobacter sp.]